MGSNVPVYNPKTRLISVRVSEHEYARLRTLSSTLGAHSLADFVRSLLSWAIDNPQQGLADPGDATALARGAPRAHGFWGRPANDHDAQVFETVLGLVRSLQWKAESSNQELADLAALLTPPQQNLRAIAAARAQITEMLRSPTPVKSEPDSGTAGPARVTSQP